jgi:hypothetical protein
MACIAFCWHVFSRIASSHLTQSHLTGAGGASDKSVHSKWNHIQQVEQRMHSGFSLNDSPQLPHPMIAYFSLEFLSGATNFNVLDWTSELGKQQRIFSTVLIETGVLFFTNIFSFAFAGCTIYFQESSVSIF